MKYLITTIAALVLVGCGESKKQSPATEPEAKPESTTVKAPDISIHRAAGEDNNEAVKAHIAAGTDLNAKDDSGWMPLHWAALRSNSKLVELLIAGGADINAKADDGKTPLDFAESGGTGTGKRNAALLRKHGAKTAEELKAAGN
jgi:hypothetical protein